MEPERTTQTNYRTFFVNRDRHLHRNSQDFADKMKIFFVAILMAVAAVAQIIWVPWDQGTFTWDTPEVTLEDLARSYLRTNNEFASMTCGEQKEAIQGIADDYNSVFHADLCCGAAVEDLNKMLGEEIIRVLQDLDYEEREAFLNSYNHDFWNTAGIKDAEITTWNWLDGSGPTLSRYAIYCQARQEWNHQPDFGYCKVGNRTEDRGAELIRRWAENRGIELR